MNTNAKISLFKPFEKGKPQIPVCEMTIHQFYENSIDSDYIDEIAALRAEQDEDRRTNLKRKLPAVTISGTFSRAFNRDIVEHSGFICLDFDGKHNPSVKSWEGLRNEMGKVPQVLLAALSVSGKGVLAIVPISNPERHISHFKSLERDFLQMGLVVDTACKNVSRLRYITSDPQAYWNPKAKVYTKLFEEPKMPKEPVNYECSGTDDLDLLIDAIAKSGKDITATGDKKSEYRNWLNVGVALYAELGAGGRNAYHAISQNYSGYCRDATDKMFDNIAKNGYREAKAGTIFYLADQAGVKIPRQVKCYLVPFTGLEDYSQKALRIAQEEKSYFIPKAAVMERAEGGLYLPEWFLKEEVLLRFIESNSKNFVINQ